FAGFYAGPSFERTAEAQFLITIFGSSPDGLPDTSDVVAQFSSATHTIDFGVLFPFTLHTVTLPTPVPVTAGRCLWIEILNDTAGNVWVWSCGGPADNLIGIDAPFVGQVPDGSYSAGEVTDSTAFGLAGSDMAFCVSIDMIA